MLRARGTVIFDDRRAAGRLLAAELEGLGAARPVVLALPRGGVPVAFEIACVLGTPLEILGVRKLGARHQPELAVGAISEEDVTIVDAEMAAHARMTCDDIDAVTQRETAELGRRIDAYRRGRPPAALDGRTVIIVDDGLATGLTMLAAVRAARRRGAGRVIVAVPVGSADAIALLRPEVEQVVCASVPSRLEGVGRWYRDFSEVTDTEVLELLVASQAGAEPGTGGAHPRGS